MDLFLIKKDLMYTSTKYKNNHILENILKK